MEKLDITEQKLQDLLTQSAQLGAQKAIEEMTVYHLMDAAKQLGVSYPTLKKRIEEGKIKTIDGRITGYEIRKYLQLV